MALSVFRKYSANKKTLVAELTSSISTGNGHKAFGKTGTRFPITATHMVSQHQYTIEFYVLRQLNPRMTTSTDRKISKDLGVLIVWQ
jgi:hypothetical protein